MVDFVDFETTVQSSDDYEVVRNEDLQEQVSDCSDLESFIDDNETEEENDRSFYQHFNNVNKSIDETLAEDYNKSIADIENFNDFSNFCEISEEEGEIDHFKDSGKRIQKFEGTIFLSSDDEDLNSFINAILFALRFNISQKSNVCDEAELKVCESEKVFFRLDKDKYKIDNQKFNTQCIEVNQMLSEHGYFMRVFELKNKFRQLIFKNATNRISLGNFLAVYMKNLMASI